jgi:hypothetical protein
MKYIQGSQDMILRSTHIGMTLDSRGRIQYHLSRQVGFLSVTSRTRYEAGKNSQSRPESTAQHATRLSVIGSIAKK